MKANRLLIPLVVGMLAATSLSASADTITVAKNGMFSIGKGTPNNPLDNLAYLKDSIALWNAGTASATEDGNKFAKLNGSLVPPPTLASFTGSYTKFDSVSNPLGFDLGTTPVDYLLVHYGGYSISYYLGGLTGLVDIQNHPLDRNGGGISSVAEFFGVGATSRTVPDGGMTLILLSAGLSGLGLVRKTVKK